MGKVTKLKAHIPMLNNLIFAYFIIQILEQIDIHTDW